MLNDFVSVQAPIMRKMRRPEHWIQWNEHPSASRSTKPMRYAEIKKVHSCITGLDLTFDNHSINWCKCSGSMRLRLAISAHERHAPCHVLSAIAGRSYKLAAAMEWISNNPKIVSKTWLAKSLGRRSASLATPLAADQRTIVSCQYAVKSIQLWEERAILCLAVLQIILPKCVQHHRGHLHRPAHPPNRV